MLLSLLVATYFSLAPTNTSNLGFNYAPLPTLLCIAQHESGIEQFDANGNPLWSPTDDVGIMQIHSSWIPVAQHMGLDVVNNPVDNIEFGIWLANTHGLKQWTTYKKFCMQSDVAVNAP